MSTIRPGAPWRGRAVAAAFIAATLLLGGCAAQDEAPAAVAPTTATIGLQSAPTSLSPLGPVTPRAAASIVKSIYSGLTKVASDAQVEPDLAEKWERKDDNHWVFTLRTGVTFSDGTPLTAETVKWNYDNQLDPDSPYVFTDYTRLAAVSEVNVIDEQTVEFVTSTPEADLPRILTTQGILDPEFAQSHNLQTEALGTGPYRLVSFDPQSETVLERNSKYFGDTPQLEKVIFRYYTDEAQRLAAVQSGEADVVTGLAVPALTSLDSGVSDYTVGSVVSTRPVFLKLNFADPAIANPKVRQALAAAIDSDALVEGVFKGYAEPTNGQLFSKSAYGTENKDITAYAYDPDLAAKLLEEAGYPDGLDLELDFVPGGLLAADLVAQNIKEQLDAVGFRIQLNSVTPQQSSEKLAAGQAPPIALSGISFGDAGWRSQLNFFDSTFYVNTFKDLEYDKLLAQLRGAFDKDDEQRLLRETSQYLYDNVAVVPLYHQPLTYAVRADLDYTPRADEWLLPAEIGSAG